MILPTIHSNGTSKTMLIEGYQKAAAALQTFKEAFVSIEFNARDYYTQSPEAFVEARQQRIEIIRQMVDMDRYLDAHIEHITGSNDEMRDGERKRTANTTDQL